MSNLHTAYIVDAVRTPVAKIRGGLSSVRPDDLLAYTLKGLIARVPQLDTHSIGDVIIGCAMPEGEQGMNVARIATLLADLPNTIAAMTINRFCASGLQAVALAAQKIQLGEEHVMLAGGVESMSRIPMGGFHYSPNLAYFNKQHLGIAYSMGLTAEKVAARWEISRSAQDEFALQSHQRALLAQQNGAFKAEILNYHKQQHSIDQLNDTIQEIIIDQDEGPRKDTSLEALAKLPTIFAQKGSVTAGNTSQMSDGAAALLLVSEQALKRYNLTPIARFVGMATAGNEPEFMGVGPIHAIPKVLKQCGLQLDQMDWIELNEAFAAQSLAVIKELALDPARVNPQGGAIALGHPLGATGAIRSATLVHGLKRQHKKYGMVTMCIGTGMGAAGIFEAL